MPEVNGVHYSYTKKGKAEAKKAAARKKNGNGNGNGKKGSPLKSRARQMDDLKQLPSFLEHPFYRKELHGKMRVEPLPPGPLTMPPNAIQKLKGPVPGKGIYGPPRRRMS